TLWRALRPFLDALAADAGEAITAVSLNVAFVKCPRCSAQTESDGAYCRACGASRDETPEGVACSVCQRENPPDARFCPGCGAPASSPAPGRLSGL
ncbi:MAG: zinc ribbon domain-containing protein, partial [Vicinamibacteria bacterium]|nr:zinc ribbon domain-containing protein [Vicinamibacteria bacterium]